MANNICTECDGLGGRWYNPDYPMGDCGARQWEVCIRCNGSGGDSRMDSIEQVLLKHEAWYDSCDQNVDSWGCICNHQTGYSSRADVIANHIMPKIRAAIDGTPERRPQNRSADVQKKIDANGKLIRANTTRHVWDDIDRLIEYTKGVGLDKIAGALEEYEEERKHLQITISNLDIQLEKLGTGHRNLAAEHARLVGILERAGMDAAVMLETDDAFKEKVDPPANMHPAPRPGTTRWRQST